MSVLPAWKVAGPDGGPAWQEAGVICPWTIYEVYGDRRVLGRNYAAMAKFVEFCRARSTPELLPPAKYHCFGDWLSINADTPKDIIYTAYFAYSAKLMSRIADALGKTNDAGKYRDLFNQIKAAFNKAYVAEDGRIKGDTQTCYVLALVVGLVDGEKAKLAAKYLVENIEARDGHLSTGFIGTKDLMLALAKIGRNDAACWLIHNDTFPPSWSFSIKHGATSIWERWNMEDAIVLPAKHTKHAKALKSVQRRSSRKLMNGGESLCWRDTYCFACLAGRTTATNSPSTSPFLRTPPPPFSSPPRAPTLSLRAASHRGEVPAHGRRPRRAGGGGGELQV